MGRRVKVQGSQPWSEGSEREAGVSRRYFAPLKNLLRASPAESQLNRVNRICSCQQTTKPFCPEMPQKCHCRSVNGDAGEIHRRRPKARGSMRGFLAGTSEGDVPAAGRSLHRSLGQALGSVCMENSCFGLNINNAK